MVKAKIKTPDYRTFVNGLLPKVMQEIHEKILSKLNQATSISLITDIWTNKQLKDFIAVVASIINSKFQKELVVIGFSRMPGKHNAENVKKAVEVIVNKYEFDKNKISSIRNNRNLLFNYNFIYLKGITVDEESNMVRLFSQIENSTNLEELLTFPVLSDLNKDNSDERIDANDSDSDSDSEEHCLENIDEEIEFSLKEISTLKFTEIPVTETEEPPFSFEIDFEHEYDTNRGECIRSLEIVLGSDLLPRISCAAHKANSSVRAAIKKHDPLARLLKTLSKFCAISHRSINIANFHFNNKSRLRCDNQTRWNSSFLMLVSVKKAYDKNTFNEEYKCPHSLSTIEKYIQLLLPAYRFSLFMQRNDCPIGEVVPLLLIMFEEYEKLKLNGALVTGTAKSFKDLLVSSFKKKFAYELESNVYLVSSIFTVSKLNLWY